MKIRFKAKYGTTEIDIPVNGGKIHADNAPAGLSNLAGEIFTIINQIPESSHVSTRKQWIKNKLVNCGKRDGIYDQSSGTMAYKANTWTAYIYDWQNYRPPHWLEKGYYSLAEEEKTGFFTVAVGDLIVFADIPDDVPTNISEFNALKKKYESMGGIITGQEVYINYKPDGKPWRTNHIEAIKG